jgi:hypothetical protein
MPLRNIKGKYKEFQENMGTEAVNGVAREGEVGKKVITEQTLGVAEEDLQTQSNRLRGTSYLLLFTVVTSLTFLIIFKQEVPQFHFELGFTF